METKTQTRELVLFLQKTMENAMDAGDMETVTRISEQIDSVMLRMVTEDTAAHTTNAM